MLLEFRRTSGGRWPWLVGATMLLGSLARADGTAFRTQPSLATRSSLAGDTEDPLPGISPSAKGSLEVSWPFAVPEAFGPILVAPFPAYSTQHGLSRWGKGWQEPLYVETAPLEGAPSASWFKRKLDTPWGRFVEGTDGFWYPVGLSSPIRGRKTDGWFEFYLPGHVRVRFQEDAREPPGNQVYRWRLVDAEDERGHQTRYQWERDPSGQGWRLASVSYGLHAEGARLVFSYRRWSSPFLIGGRRGFDWGIDQVVDRIEVIRNGRLIESQQLRYFERADAWFPLLSEVQLTRGSDLIKESFDYFRAPTTIGKTVHTGDVVTRLDFLDSVPLDIDGNGRPVFANFKKRRAYRVELPASKGVTSSPLPITSTAICPWDLLGSPPTSGRGTYVAGRLDRDSPLRLIGLSLEKCGGGAPSAASNCLAVKVCNTAGAVESRSSVRLNDAFPIPDLRGASWVDVDRDARPDLVVFGSVSSTTHWVWQGEDGFIPVTIPSVTGEAHVFRGLGQVGSVVGAHEMLHDSNGRMIVLNPEASHQIVDYNSDGLTDVAEVERGVCGENILARVRIRYGLGEPLIFQPPLSETVPHVPGRERSCGRWIPETQGVACQRANPPAEWAIGILEDLDGDGVSDYVGICADGLVAQFHQQSFDGSRTGSVTYASHALPLGRESVVKGVGRFFRDRAKVADFLFAENRPTVLNPGHTTDRSWYSLSWGDYRQWLMKRITSPKGHRIDFDYSLDEEGRSALLTSVTPFYRGGLSGGGGPRMRRTVSYRNAFYEPKTRRLWGYREVTTCVDGRKPCETSQYDFDAREEGVPRIRSRSTDARGVTLSDSWEYEWGALGGVPFRRTRVERSTWKSGAATLLASTRTLGYQQGYSYCGAGTVFDPIVPSSARVQTEQGTIDQTFCFRRPMRYGDWLETSPTLVRLIETSADGTRRESTRHFEYWNTSSAFYDQGRLQADWTETGAPATTVTGCSGANRIEALRVLSLMNDPTVAYPTRVSTNGLPPVELRRNATIPELIESAVYPDGTSFEVRARDFGQAAPTEMLLNGNEHVFRTYDSRGRVTKRWSQERGETESSPGLELWYRDATTDGIDVVETAERIHPGSVRRHLSIRGADGGRAISARMERRANGSVWRWSPMFFQFEGNVAVSSQTENHPRTLITSPSAPTAVTGSPGARPLLSLDALSAESSRMVSSSWNDSVGAGEAIDATRDRRDEATLTLRASDLLLVRRRASRLTNAHAGSETIELYPSGLVKRRIRGSATATYFYYPSGDVRRIEVSRGADRITITIAGDLAGRVQEVFRSDIGGFRSCYDGARVKKTEWLDRNRAAYRSEEIDYDQRGRRSAIRYTASGLQLKTYRFSWDCDNLPPARRTAGCRGKLSGVTGPSYSRQLSYDGFGRLDSDQITVGSETSTFGYAYDSGDEPRTLTVSTTGAGLSSSASRPLTLEVVRDQDGGVQTVTAQRGGAPLSFEVRRSDAATTIRAPGGELTYGFHPATESLLDEEWYTGSFQAKHHIDEFVAGFIGVETYEWHALRGANPSADTRSRRYEYDENQRLRSVSGTGRTERYTYDPDGRPQSLTVGGTTRRWTRTALDSTSDDGIAIVRDPAGRVTSLRRQDAGPRTIQFRYGADGQIESVTDGSETLEMVLDEKGVYLGARNGGGQIIDDEALGGMSRRRFPLHIGGHDVGWLSWMPSGPAGPSTLSFEPRLGDPRGTRILSGAGAAIEPTAFGEIPERIERGRALLDAAFVGRQWSATAGGVRMPHRQYLPEAGEFLTPDPLAFVAPGRCVDELGRCFAHQYSFNDVIAHVDRTGLEDGEARRNWRLEDELIGGRKRTPLPIPSPFKNTEWGIEADDPTGTVRDFNWGFANGFFFGIPKHIDTSFNFHYLNDRKRTFKAGEVVGAVSSIVATSLLGAYLQAVRYSALGVDFFGTAEISKRVQTIHGALDSIAASMRTTTVLETVEAVNIVSASGQGLSRAQLLTLEVNEIGTALRCYHAEKKAVMTARGLGLQPLKINVSREICPACMNYLVSDGAVLTSPFSAIWPLR